MRSRTFPSVPHLLAAALCAALLAMSHPGSAADEGTVAKASKPATETATFAGGCFWCMEPPFDATEGVLSTTVGYTGGTTVDPTNPNGQFCDVGNQYRSAIFYHSEAQKQTAERSKALLEASGKLGAPIVTQIVAASKFYPAEDYHQDYYEKNPIRYKWYRYRCGRDNRLEELWGEH